MTKTTLSKLSTEKTQQFVEENWVNPPQSDVTRRQVLSRGAYLALVPTTFITRALDTIIGMGIGIGAVCTLGKNENILRKAFNFLYSSHQLIEDPFCNFLKAINIEAKLHRKPYQFYIPMELKSTAKKYYQSSNFLERHVVSRLTYVLLALACIITRVVGLVLGVLLAPLTIVTCGNYSSLNVLTCKALQAPGIIHDLFFCTIKFINPSAGKSFLLL